MPSLEARHRDVRDAGQSSDIDLTEPALDPKMPEEGADALVIHAATVGCGAYLAVATGGTIRTGVRYGSRAMHPAWTRSAVPVEKLGGHVDSGPEIVERRPGPVREAWTAGNGVSTRCWDRRMLQTTRCSGLGLTEAGRRAYI